VKAALYEEFGGPVEIVDVPSPEVPAGGVVLEVGANGICRSDWHAWMGHDPSIALPHVPGHEMAGTVVAKASEVEGFDIGDRVTVPFVLGCGACPECSSGNHQTCNNQYQPGFDGFGAFAEFVALPYAVENLVRIPDDMTFEAAAGLGCRFATAYRAVVDQGEVTEGSNVAIWGCGGVGLSAVMIAASIGARVIAVDIDETALEIASGFGASEIVLARDGLTDAETVRELFEGGANVSIDALGSSQTAASSILCLAKRGRHVQVGLMIGESSDPVVPMWRLHADEITLRGVHGMQASQYASMLRMISQGTISPGALVSRTVTLPEGAEHLVSMDSLPGRGFVVINDFTGI
jgi:alcohol dehydrogenase